MKLKNTLEQIARTPPIIIRQSNSRRREIASMVKEEYEKARSELD